MAEFFAGIQDAYNKIWAFVLDVLAKFGITTPNCENVPEIFLPDAE